MVVSLSKVTSQPPKGLEPRPLSKPTPGSEQQVQQVSSQSPDPTDSASSEGLDLATVELNAISPMFYIDLRIGKALVRSLIDSGSSSNFIPEHVTHELNLRRNMLHDGQTFKVANGDEVHCTQFVHVYVHMHTVKFYLNLRVAPQAPGPDTWCTLSREV